jgi:hypothetical protein
MTSPSNDPRGTRDSKPESIAPPDPEPSSDTLLSAEALAKQQEEYRQAYLLQIQRMNCPGCGDDGFFGE